MASRKIRQFKHANAFWKLRVQAKTGVVSPGWSLALLTALPPANLPPVPDKVRKIKFETDRLLRTYYKKHPEALDDPPREVDGRPVNQSMIFVLKQHEFMKAGHSESEAFDLAQKALADEEEQALKKLQEITSEARAMGAVPALSFGKEESDTWKKMQFWRTELSKSPYESWPHGKRASLDYWITRNILQWEAYQMRYLGREDFKAEMVNVREAIFGDVIHDLKSKLFTETDDGELEGVDVSAEDIISLRKLEAQKQYRGFGAKILERRSKEWSAEKMEELQSWLHADYKYIIQDMKGLYMTSTDNEEEEDPQRKKAKVNVLQYMAFPLLRPEFQVLPYLSKFLTRSFLAISRPEAIAGLKYILQVPLAGPKPDYILADKLLEDYLPKLVVKSFAVVARERPFSWRLLRHQLLELTNKHVQDSSSIVFSLPELQGKSTKEEVVEHIESCYKNLTDLINEFLESDETSSLGDDIKMIYQAINELHRVAQELLHLEGTDSGTVSPIDAEIEAVIKAHHGWIRQELAIADVIRRYDETSEQTLSQGFRQFSSKQRRLERRKADALERRRLNATWRARDAGRYAWELEAGLIEDVDPLEAIWNEGMTSQSTTQFQEVKEEEADEGEREKDKHKKFVSSAEEKEEAEVQEEKEVAQNTARDFFNLVNLYQKHEVQKMKMSFSSKDIERMKRELKAEGVALEDPIYKDDSAIIDRWLRSQPEPTTAENKLSGKNRYRK